MKGVISDALMDSLHGEVMAWHPQSVDPWGDSAAAIVAALDGAGFDIVERTK